MRLQNETQMPSRHPRGRVRSSPLIDPAVCCVLLLAPPEQAYQRLPQQVRSSFEGKVSALTAAAAIADVPVFVWWPGHDRQAAASYLSPGAKYQHFAGGAQALPWLNSELAAGLDKEDRADLLIGGFWLEYQVLATGLHALATGYDVYLLADIARAQSPRAASSTLQRLMLQGARPALTSHVMHEWFLASADDERARLHGLLEPVPWSDGDRGIGASP